MGLLDLQIIAFWFYFNFTQRPNLFDIAVVKCLNLQCPYNPWPNQVTAQFIMYRKNISAKSSVLRHIPEVEPLLSEEEELTVL